MIWTAIALAAAVCEACGAYDVVKTEQGLKKGVAVEAFTFLVGPKPSAVALYLRDQILLAGCAAPAIILALMHNTPLAYGACVGLLAYGLKHIQGGLKWAFLIKGGKLDWDGFPIPADGKAVSHSAWAKFIGPWC